MSNPLVDTQIVDKNGVLTRRKKRVGAPTATARRAGSVKPKSVTKKYASKGPSLKERLDGYKDELQNAVSALANDKNWNEYLVAMQKFRSYSWNNQLLIALQTGGKATRVAGYKTWESLGRHVKKGEKSIVINGYGTKKVDQTDKSGNVVMGADGKPEQRTIPIFFGVGVFDISQTEGDPLPESHRPMTSTPPPGLTEDLENAIKQNGFTIEYVENLGGPRGSTSPSNKKVQILDSLGEAERAKVLAHELMHIECGHLDRIEEYHTGHGGQRNVMEIEADSAAYVLLRANGMDEHIDSVSTYVAGWAGVRMGNDREKVVADAAATIAKTNKAVLEKFGWRNVEDGVA